MWEMSFVCAAGQDSPPNLQGFSQMVGLEEGVEQSIHGGGDKQDESRWKFFGKMGNKGSIILEDNSAGHRFVLKDLGSIKEP